MVSKRGKSCFFDIKHRIKSVFNPKTIIQDITMRKLGLKQKSKFQFFFEFVISLIVKANQKLLNLADKIVNFYRLHFEGKIGLFLKAMKFIFTFILLGTIKKIFNRIKDFYKKDKKRAVIYFILLYICYRTISYLYYKTTTIINNNRNNDIVVLTRVVEPIRAEKEINCYGYLESENNLNYQSEVRGNIDKIFVQEKQMVKEGQVLMVLDSKFTANSYISTKSILESKKLQYEAIKRLYQQGIESKGNLKSMEADLENATSNFESAKKAYNGLIVKAPFDGFIDNISKKEGSQINPGERLFSLERTNALQVKCDVQNLNLNEVNIGDTANIFINGNSMATGEIAVIGDSIDVYSGSRSILINKVKSNEGFEDRIRPGISVMIKIFANAQKDVYKISSEALELTKTGSYMVKILNPDDDKNIVATKNVIVFNEIDGFDYVEGLSSGDYVIERGHEFVESGEKNIKYNVIDKKVVDVQNRVFSRIATTTKKVFLYAYDFVVFVKNDIIEIYNNICLKFSKK